MTFPAAAAVSSVNKTEHNWMKAFLFDFDACSFPGQSELFEYAFALFLFSGLSAGGVLLEWSTATK